MAFLVSPGVRITETDLTNIIPAVSTSIGGFAGNFEWGPTNTVTQVSSEADLIRQFGYPKISTVTAESTRDDWYAAANFLGYTNNLQLVRLLSDGALNAVSEADSENVVVTVAFDSETSGLGAVARGDSEISIAGFAVRVTEGSTPTSVAADLDSDIAVLYGRSNVSVSGAVITINTTDIEHDSDLNRFTSSAEVTTSDSDAADNTREITISTSFTSTETIADTVIENEDDFEVKRTTLTDGSIYARYPGLVGNGIGVVLIDAGIVDSDFTGTSLFGTTNTPSTLFDTKPGTSTWARNLTDSDVADEVHVVVFTTTDQPTGTVNQVLETYSYLSKAKNGRTADGAPNYYVDVINTASEWIYLLNEETAATNGVLSGGAISIGATISNNVTGSFKSFRGKGVAARNASNNWIGGVRKYDLKGGSLGSTLSNGNYTAAYDKLNDVETVDISLVFVGEANGSSVVQKHAITLCETRKDCIAFVSPDYASAVNNPTARKVTDYFAGFNSSSYVVFDSGWKRQYDRYNDEYFWSPLNADIAGLAARTDYTNEAWFSPAGLNRGFIRDVVKLSFNPNQADRDALYTQRVNPVVTFRGQGTLLYGDKTGLSRPSAFDRINVRRLFIVLEKAIATAAKFQLFEFNDDLTRRTFVNAVEPFLQDILSRRGLTDFRVVCDESNNTPEVIDGNRFVADIYIKPTRSINFITLNFVAVRTGVSFSEVAGG